MQYMTVVVSCLQYFFPLDLKINCSSIFILDDETSVTDAIDKHFCILLSV